MGKVKGATRTDKAAHWLYDVACTYGTGGRNHGHRCPRCGTMLLTAYHEERLYSVQCPACSVVSLVKASNPAAAEAQVARPDGLAPIPLRPGDVLYETDGEHGVVKHTVTDVHWMANTRAEDDNGQTWADYYSDDDIETAHATRAAAEAQLGEQIQEGSA